MCDFPEPFASQIAGVAQAVAFPRGLALDWFGEHALRAPASWVREVASDAAETLLRTTLERHLYQNFYVTGQALPTQRTPFTVDASAQEYAFRRSLIDANRLPEQMQDGWLVESVDDERIVVSRNGLKRQSTPDVLASRGGTSPKLDDEMSLKVATAYDRLSPGYIFFQKDGGASGDDIVRVYFHIVPRAAPDLVELVTHKIGDLSFPFSFKILGNPGGYERCDTAVLYFDARYAMAVAPVLRAVVDALDGLLFDPVPALTLRLAPGIGIAEDPGDGSSFGQARMRIVANGLMTARAQGDYSATSATKQIAKAVREAGLSPARPFLRKASSGTWLQHFHDIDRPRVQRKISSQRDPAALAEAIGTSIAERAIWHDGRCTWMGAVNEPARLHSERRVTALDGSLYDGTAGLAVVFAELAAAGAGLRFGDIALGALRHADMHFSGPGPHSLSTYSGTMGLAWAAGVVAACMDSDEAAHIARRTLARLSDTRPEQRETDILSGAAGVLQALIALEDLDLADPELPLTAGIVEALKAAAVQSRSQVFWPDQSKPAGSIGLTGYSHGAAGIAAALTVAARRTNDAACLDLARGALRFESAHYDASAQNWRDLRSRGGGGRSQCATYWCHGAPGIALGRAIMSPLVDWPELGSDLTTALDTTARILERSAGQPHEAHCLCHGLPGNALSLETAARHAGCDFKRLQDPIDQVRHAMLESYGSQERSSRRGYWDFGTPGLMLGASGIAYYFIGSTTVPKSNPLDLSISPPRRHRRTHKSPTRAA